MIWLYILYQKPIFNFEHNIYGEGIKKNKLQKLIAKFNLQKKIKINPYILHSEIYSVLDKNDVFILPSIKETLGVAYIEAMARGLVIAGCKNTSIDGIIKDENNGFLTEPSVKSITIHSTK